MSEHYLWLMEILLYPIRCCYFLNRFHNVPNTYGKYTKDNQWWQPSLTIPMTMFIGDDHLLMFVDGFHLGSCSTPMGCQCLPGVNLDPYHSRAVPVCFWWGSYILLEQDEKGVERDIGGLDHDPIHTLL